MNVDDFTREGCDSSLHLVETLFKLTLFGAQIFRPHRDGHLLEHGLEFTLGRLELLKSRDSFRFVHLLHSWWQALLLTQFLSLLGELSCLFFVFLEIFGNFAVVFMLIRCLIRSFLGSDLVLLACEDDNLRINGLPHTDRV